MTTALRILHDLLLAPHMMTDPGDAGTITVDRDLAIVPIVSTGADETRTLAQPTKAGLRCVLLFDTDGGDVTVTVTGGYDIPGQTTFTLNTAGSIVELISTKVGASYYWRMLSRAGVTKALPFEAQTIDMSDAAVTLTKVPGTPSGTLLYGNWLLVDPNSSGAAEVLKMPPEADCANEIYVIKNTGGEHITLQNDAAGAIGTIEDAEAAILHCDGTSWTIIQVTETT